MSQCVIYSKKIEFLPQTSLLLVDAYSVELQIPVLFQDAVENSVVEPETLEVEAVDFDLEQVEAVETGFGLRVAVPTAGPFAWAELGSNSVGQLEHLQLSGFLNPDEVGTDWLRYILKNDQVEKIF